MMFSQCSLSIKAFPNNGRNHSCSSIHHTRSACRVTRYVTHGLDLCVPHPTPQTAGRRIHVTHSKTCLRDTRLVSTLLNRGQSFEPGTLRFWVLSQNNCFGGWCFQYWLLPRLFMVSNENAELLEIGEPDNVVARTASVVRTGFRSRFRAPVRSSDHEIFFQGSKVKSPLGWCTFLLIDLSTSSVLSVA